MSKYTTELRYLIETHFDLGLKNYPIFDESYREHLNDKIINHYYFREIGFETAEIFKFYLNRTMDEIMPYYNQLYKSEMLTFDPLSTRLLTEDYSKNNTVDSKQNSNEVQTGSATQTGRGTQSDAGTQTSKGTQTGNDKQTTSSSTTNDNKKITSDTPQGLLSIGDIENNLYASSANIDSGNGISDSTAETTSNTTTENTAVTNSSSSSESTSTSNLTNDKSSDSSTNTNAKEVFTRNFKGLEGNASELLKSYRDTFLNIDMLVIEELNSLFMGLW